MAANEFADIPSDVAAQLRSFLCVLDFIATTQAIIARSPSTEPLRMILPFTAVFDRPAMTACDYSSLIGKIIDCLYITPDIEDVFRSQISDEMMELFIKTLPKIRSHSKIEMCEKGLQISTPLLFYEIFSRPLAIFHSEFELSYRQLSYVITRMSSENSFVSAKGPSAVSNYIRTLRRRRARAGKEWSCI